MNFSQPPNDTESLYKRPWFRDEILAACSTAITIYLAITLSMYELRHKNEQKLRRFGWRELEAFLIRGSVCLIAVFICVIRVFFEQIELRLGTVFDLACRFYQVQLIITYHISDSCIYVLLWARQVKMYRHRALRHLRSSALKVASIMVLVGMLGCFLTNIVTYIVFFTLVSSPDGCVYSRSIVDGPPSFLPGVIAFFGSLVFQFSLLGLLVYPMIKQYKVCCRSAVSRVWINTNVRKTMVRLFVCTTICVVSDGLTSYLLVYVYDGSTPLFFWANMYTVNLLCNIITVICSFANWKQRLFSFYNPDYKAILTTKATKTISRSAV